MKLGTLWCPIVVCMAWPQAKSQAKPSPRSQGQAKPNGLAWRWLWPGFGSQKPKPSHKAKAFVELFSISKRWGFRIPMQFQ